MGCVIGRIHYGLKVIFCFRHFTAFHYHHCARLLTGTAGIHIIVCRVSCGVVVFNMLLFLSITFYFSYNIWGCMCSTGPFQYRWLKGYIYSSCYHHHQIFPTFPTVIIFFRDCVPEMFVTSYSVTYCIYVPGKPGICFHHYCAVYDECKLVGNVLACRSYPFFLYSTPSHYHHCANLSEDIELIKCPSDLFCRVCE